VRGFVVLPFLLVTRKKPSAFLDLCQKLLGDGRGLRTPNLGDSWQSRGKGGIVLCFSILAGKDPPEKQKGDYPSCYDAYRCALIYPNKKTPEISNQPD